MVMCEMEQTLSCVTSPSYSERRLCIFTFFRLSTDLHLAVSVAARWKRHEAQLSAPADRCPRERANIPLSETSVPGRTRFETACRQYGWLVCWQPPFFRTSNAICPLSKPTACGRRERMTGTFKFLNIAARGFRKSSGSPLGMVGAN